MISALLLALLQQASALHDRGELGQAAPLYRQAIGLIEAQHGPQHASLTEPFNSLASLYFDQGRYGRAEEYAARAHVLARAGGTPAQIARITANLAAAWQAKGDLDRAASLYQEALSSLPDAASSDAAYLYNNLGLLELAQSRNDAARMSIEKARALWRLSLPERHPLFALSAGNLARIHGLAGRHREADQLWRQAIEMAESSLGRGHYLTGRLYAAWAGTLRQLKQKVEAKAAERNAREILDRAQADQWRNGVIDIRTLQSMTPLSLAVD